MENTGKVLGALLLGAAVGVGIGILLAPEKGSETRKKILDGSKDLTDQLKEKFNEGMSKLRSMDEKAEEKIDEFVRTAKSKVENHVKPKTDMA